MHLERRLQAAAAAPFSERKGVIPTRFNYRPIASFPGTMPAWLASCAWNKRKVRIALRQRRETTMTLTWIAEQPAVGAWANAARRLYEAKT